MEMADWITNLGKRGDSKLIAVAETAVCSVVPILLGA